MITIVIIRPSLTLSTTTTTTSTLLALWTKKIGGRKNLFSFSIFLYASCWPFHQHFTSSSFAQKCLTQLFSAYSLALLFSAEDYRQKSCSENVGEIDHCKTLSNSHTHLCFSGWFDCLKVSKLKIFFKCHSQTWMQSSHSSHFGPKAKLQNPISRCTMEYFFDFWSLEWTCL